MARSFYVLTDRDREALVGLVRQQYRQTGLHRSGSSTPEDPGTSPDVYAALTPVGGIPARSGDQLGAAECIIYRSVDGQLVALDGVTRTVHNLTTTAVPGESWVKVTRDKFGTWYTDQTGGGVSSSVGSITISADQTPLDGESYSFIKITATAAGFTINGFISSLTSGEEIILWNVGTYPITLAEGSTPNQIFFEGHYPPILYALQSVSIRRDTVANNWRLYRSIPASAVQNGIVIADNHLPVQKLGTNVKWFDRLWVTALTESYKVHIYHGTPGGGYDGSAAVLERAFYDDETDPSGTPSFYEGFFVGSSEFLKGHGVLYSSLTDTPCYVVRKLSVPTDFVGKWGTDPIGNVFSGGICTTIATSAVASLNGLSGAVSIASTSLTVSAAGTTVTLSVKTTQSVTLSVAGEVRLVGDSAAPGASRFYKTDTGGNKGWGTASAVSGSFTTVDGKTVTVTNGIVTAIT